MLSFSGHEHIHGQIGSIGYCNNDAMEQNRLIAAMLRATFSAQRVAIADTYTAVASSCGGASYRDCAIQRQFDDVGRRYMCNVHFGKASFAEVHGPAIAKELARLLL
jgi:hypothetical protein